MGELIRRILSEGCSVFESQGWGLSANPAECPQMRSYDLVEVCVTTPKDRYVVEWIVQDYSDRILRSMLGYLLMNVKARQ